MPGFSIMYGSFCRTVLAETFFLSAAGRGRGFEFVAAGSSGLFLSVEFTTLGEALLLALIAALAFLSVVAAFASGAAVAAA